MKTLGQRIKSAREEAGLLQSDLATRINGKSSGVISNWEKDKSKPDADKIVSLCQALGVSCSYLLDYYGAESLNAAETELVSLFRELNDDGQLAAISAIKGILSESHYIKTEIQDSVIESA